MCEEKRGRCHRMESMKRNFFLSFVYLKVVHIGVLHSNIITFNLCIFCLSCLLSVAATGTSSLKRALVMVKDCFCCWIL